jgi:hypothetical protein
VSTTTARASARLKLDDFLSSHSTEQTCQEEYFELKHKFDSMKTVNAKIYNLALEKIFNP